MVVGTAISEEAATPAVARGMSRGSSGKQEEEAEEEEHQQQQ